MANLAINGGKPAVQNLTPYISMGEEEIAAVTKVMRSGCISKFLGAWGPDFFGGETIRAMVVAWGKKFDCQYSGSDKSAKSVRSASVGSFDDV